MRNVKNLPNIRRFLSLFMIFALFCVNFGVLDVGAAFTPDAKIYSEGVYMVNLDTDIVVYKKNETARVYPASTTKIMTCLIILENVADLDQKVTVSSGATNEFWEDDPNKWNPAHASLEIGQTNLTYRDCLYVLMLSSACEAANVLALNLAGDIASFVAMMNAKADELGCVNTHFGNAHGLHQTDNYSSAYDMYLITKYAYDNYPLFMEICDTYDYYMPANTNNPGGYTITTRNQLMRNNAENRYYYDYAHGVKTGSIDYFIDVSSGEKVEGNSNLVSTAQKDGFAYMLVTLGAPYHDLEDGTTTRPYSFDDHLSLYKWAFGTFTYQQVLSKNDILKQIPVLQGEGADYVQLKPMDDYLTLLPKDLDQSTIQRIYTLNYDEVTAPVTKGEILGQVELRLADETLATVNLIASEGVERSQMAYMTEQLKGVLDQSWFKAIVAVVAALAILLVILHAINTAKKSNTKGRRPRR